MPETTTSAGQSGPQLSRIYIALQAAEAIGGCLSLVSPCVADLAQLAALTRYNVAPKSRPCQVLPGIQVSRRKWRADSTPSKTLTEPCVSSAVTCSRLLETAGSISAATQYSVRCRVLRRIKIPTRSFDTLRFFVASLTAVSRACPL